MEWVLLIGILIFLLYFLLRSAVKGGVLDGADGVLPLAEGDVHIFQGQQDLPAVFRDRSVLRQSAGADVIFLLQCSHFFLLPPKY